MYTWVGSVIEDKLSSVKIVLPVKLGVTGNFCRRSAQRQYRCGTVWGEVAVFHDVRKGA